MTPSATFPKPIALLEIKGRDARDLLNRISTVNLRGMIPGDFKSGFFLNPQGKTQAAFRIAFVTDETFLIEIEDDEEGTWKKAFLKYLDQFTFSEKYELNEKTELKCAWVFGILNSPENSYESKDDLIFLQGASKQFGTGWISIWGTDPQIENFLGSKNIKRLTDSEFNSLRVESLAPKSSAELSIDSNPLELGLRDGIADNKGCYPGQEVIEKIISLGSPAKRLSKLIGSGAVPSLGEKVLLGENEVGIISSVTSTPRGFSALALLRKNAATLGQQLSVSGTPVTVERISHYE